MTLELSEQDQLDYNEKYTKLAKLRDLAVQYKNYTEAKRYRQQISALYREYVQKQLPNPEQEPSTCACPNCGYILTIT